MKECLADQQWSRDLLLVYDELVQACLASCGVHLHHPYRQDLEQIAYITLIYGVISYRDDLQSEESIDRFAGYVYQRIRWRVIDELRRLERSHLREQRLDDQQWQVLGTDQSRKRAEEITETEDLYRRLCERLSRGGQQYLEGAYRKGLTVTEMSRSYGVSRQTIYNWRKEVQDVSRQLLKGGNQ